MAITVAPQFPAIRQRAWVLSPVISACLGIVTVSCGENTDKVIFQAPATLTAASGGNAAGVNAAGGASSSIVSSGGVTTGGAVSIGGASTGGAANGGSSTASTGPLMSAVGAPIGFASVGGSGTTGGGRLPAVNVTTCSDLKTWLELDDNPRVVVIDSNGVNCNRSPADQIVTCQLSCDSTTNDTTRKAYRVLPVNAADCSAVTGGNAATPKATMPRNETIIYVKSNKTLLGKGPNSIITGATLYLQSTVSNVIVQNLNLTTVNPAILEAGDAITIDGANHVWVDHCYFKDVSDGFVDTVTAASNITLSWNHFNGLNTNACAGQHNYANTVEGATVTFHHNFYEYTLGCSPKVSKVSKVHLFNNYWQNVLYYSIQVATQAQALIQGNYFNASKKPYYGSDSCLTSTTPCAISAPSTTPNLFEGISTSESQDTGGTVDPLPYDPSTYQLEDAGVIKTEVPTGSGPTLSP